MNQTSEEYKTDYWTDTLTASEATTAVSRRSCPEDGSLGLAVVEALAEARGISPLNLDPPLQEVVDLEALTALFGSSSGPTEGRVVFTVDGYEVTVTAGNDVFVEEFE